jgi:uncharacterized protein
MAANDAVVLDTNVALDWLVFDDARVAALAAAIESRSLRWLSCLPMRQEFERTLGYRMLSKWQPDCERSLSKFDQHAVIEPAPHTLPALRCSDPDDQIFLDLAVAAGAGWLLTHDRALLRLAKRAAALGVRIVPPARWPG